MIGNNLHLTTSDPELEAKARATVPGMAHWAEPASNKKMWRVQVLARRAEQKVCASLREVQPTDGRSGGPRIPHDTFACKYFVTANPIETLSK
jgi:hypothetical protein